MGGEIGAGATLAGTLLGRELTIMGWIANVFGVCVLLVIVLFVASLWHENRKPVTHLVLGAMPDEIGDDTLAMLHEDIDAEWERINRG